MTSRIVVLSAVFAFSWAFPSNAQVQYIPVIPAEVAPSTEPSTDVSNPDLEAYLGARLAVPGREQTIHLKALHATAMPGIVAAELENSWLRFHIRLATSDTLDQQPSAFRTGDSPLEDLLTAFAQLSPAPQVQIEAKLLRLGVRFADVYSPASPPYFNDAKGVVWIPKQHRFVLSVRGVDDAASNRCFKAVVDLSNGDLITRVSVACSIE